MWDEITYPFLNFNGCTVEVQEWISNFIPHFIIGVITYPLNRVSKSDPWRQPPGPSVTTKVISCIAVYDVFVGLYFCNVFAIFYSLSLFYMLYLLFLYVNITSVCKITLVKTLFEYKMEPFLDDMLCLICSLIKRYFQNSSPLYSRSNVTNNAIVLANETWHISSLTL